ncbi:MAG: hypothetical protein ABI442_17465 [Gemmatimonadaceae bacterium]
MSGSLSELTSFVPDAFAVVNAQAYKPENIVIGEYTFLPWVRAGIISGVTQARGPVRADVAVAFDVQDDADGSTSVSKTLTVRGPGDVLGFDAKQIVRRYPLPGTPNAEDTFFAHVEFDRPDFPWLFTPFAPVGDQLPPWIALIVIESRLAVIRPGAQGLPPTVTTPLGELGDLATSWAWAHAQVIGGPASGPSVQTRLTDEYSDVNLSRLICPRQLAPNKSYVACIVPAFDAGVQAALGAPGGTTAAAWTRVAGDDSRQITLPVFDHWTFATTSDGDFETLAKKLVGIPAPWNVGRRIIDTSRPGGDIADLGADDQGPIQIIRCALTAPSTAKKPEGAPDDTAAWSSEKTVELATQLNLPETLSAQFVVGGNDDLPIIGPRIYARFQRGSNVVDQSAATTDWFDELNLAPTNRIVAGLGTRVVGKDREQLMQAAWAQVGEINKANSSIRLAQAARFVGASIHARHLSALPIGALAQVTRGLQGKIKVSNAALTLLGTAARSAAAPAALTGAFRRITRPRGPLARYIDAPGRIALDRLVANGATIRDFRRVYSEPDGVVTLSAVAQSGISAATAARVLGVSPAVALAHLATTAARFASLPSTIDQLLAPVASWKPRSTTVDVGARVAEQVLATVHAAMPSRIVAQPSRAETLGTLFEGLANSRTPVAASARESINNIGTKLPVRTFTTPAAPGLPAAQRIRPVAARFESSAALQLSMTIAGARNVRSELLASELSAFARGIGAADLPVTRSRPPLVIARDALLAAIHPKVTVTAQIKGRFARMPRWLPPKWFDDGFVRPIMAAPVITVPMYERLDAYDRDWLVPGLKTIAQNDFVTLLETNPRFTESFLAGLSDEMGRELLWRGYPTDQRGTYFRRFWTADRDELAKDLHQFTRTPLGTHLDTTAGGIGRIVLVVRGELIRRYPDAITLGLRAIQPVDGYPTFVDPSSPVAKPVAPVLFHAFLPPDVLLVGFDLTEDDLVPNRWWFVIAEHPTAPRFGLVNGASPPLAAHAGLVAHNVLHEPFRAAFEASRLVAPAQAGG